MKSLILAGGFGTRLYPLTENTPKALLKVNGKTMIDHLLEKIMGIPMIEETHILSNNKFYENFIDWKNTSGINHKIRILNNGVDSEKEKKGAVGDLKFALNFIEEDDLLLLASDNLFDFNLNGLIDFANEKNASAMILRKTDDMEVIKRCNHVFFDDKNRIIFFEEKPKEPKNNVFGIACYFLKKDDVKKIKEHEFESLDNLGNIISFLHKDSKVYGKIFDGFWADIGNKEELQMANKLICQKVY